MEIFISRLGVPKKQVLLLLRTIQQANYCATSVSQSLTTWLQRFKTRIRLPSSHAPPESLQGISWVSALHYVPTLRRLIFHRVRAHGSANKVYNNTPHFALNAFLELLIIFRSFAASEEAAFPCSSSPLDSGNFY